MAEKARSAARRKRQRKIVEEYCSYIVKIKDWELTYSHELNSSPKLSIGQYSEHLELSIKGSFHIPQKYSAKEVSLTWVQLKVRVNLGRAAGLRIRQLLILLLNLRNQSIKRV